MPDKNLILLGVTGGIAAYKSAELVRLLQKEDLEVKVVMTKHATEFVGPTTFRALTGHEVALDLFDDPDNPIHHISLSTEPACFVIAPATANVIAKIAQGVADDLLTTTAVAFQGPLVVAPAMNEAMLDDVTTRENLALLEARGVRVVTSEHGYLACGESGSGRLADIGVIRDAVIDELSRSTDMQGTHVVITAGPTVEPIDAVRYVTNRSSGKMGYALAIEALARKAQVTLISGPVALRAPQGATVIDVDTALEMRDALLGVARDADIIICTAAVSDFRPTRVSQGKLKKGKDTDALATVEMIENPDLLAEVGALNNAGTLVKNPFIVGFAAETDDLIENARTKLETKGADLIVANDVSRPDIGFGADDNEVTLVTHDRIIDIDAAPKRHIARQILDAVALMER